MPDLISLSDISHSYGAEPLFEGLDLTVRDGERLGLIGANGSGKSTLLRILTGLINPETGRRVAHGGPHIALVAQDDRFADDATPRTVLAAAQPGGLEAGSDCSPTLVAALETHDLADIADQPISQLSGGWRKRVAIAAGLIADPDLLLLDEPTNHLDLAAIWQLQERLTQVRCAVVIISHDRWFLDSVVDRMIELGASYPAGLFQHPGNYRDFVAAREAFLDGQRASQQRLANRLRREDAWLARRPKARTTKSVARIRQAEVLRADLAVVQRRNAAGRSPDFDFQATGRRGNELVVAEGIGKSFGDNRIFANLDCTLAPGCCLGLIGLNGSGKTTLMQVLAGTLAPDYGQIRHAHALRIATFSQDRRDLDPQRSLRRTLCPQGDHVRWGDGTMHIAAYARRFLFAGHQLDQAVASLSGGEQARLLIALLMLQPADLLLLDEPTNDLDIPSLEVLEEALLDFPGAVVLITHDRFLLDRVCDQLIALDGRGAAWPVADMHQWEQAHGQPAAEPAANPAPEPATPSQPSQAALSWPEQKELRGLPDRIERAEARLATLEAQAVDPVIGTDPEALLTLSADIQAQQDAIDELYRRWESLSAREA